MIDKVSLNKFKLRLCDLKRDVRYSIRTEQDKHIKVHILEARQEFREDFRETFLQINPYGLKHDDRITPIGKAYFSYILNQFYEVFSEIDDVYLHFFIGANDYDFRIKEE